MKPARAFFQLPNEREPRAHDVLILGPAPTPGFLLVVHHETNKQYTVHKSYIDENKPEPPKIS